jgi:hypothetical protein
VQRPDKVSCGEVDVDHDSLGHRDRQVDDLRVKEVGEQGDRATGSGQPRFGHHLVQVANDIGVGTRGVRAQSS